MSVYQFLLIFIIGIHAVSGMAQTSSSRLDIHGYLDTQYQWERGRIEVQEGVYIPGQANEFAIHKGSLEFTGSLEEETSFLVDLPFHQTRTNPESSNNLDFATERAQAYMQIKYTQGWSWKFGQFDTPFGMESNDTNTIMYRNLGILYDVTPNTHTGLLAQYSWSNWWAFAMAANANQMSSQSADHETEFGAKMGFTDDEEGIFFNFGLLANKQKGAYDVAGESLSYKRGYLMDLQAGIDVAGTTLAINAIYVIPGQEYVEEQGEKKEREVTTGMMATLESQLTDMWRAGLRYEFLDNDNTNQYVSHTNVNGTGNGSKLHKVSLGFEKKFNKSLRFKGTIDMFSLNVGTGGKDVSWTEGAFVALYEF